MAKRITDKLIERTTDLDELIDIMEKLQVRMAYYVDNYKYERIWYIEDFLNLTSRWEAVVEKIRLIDDSHSSIYAGEGLGYYDIGDVLC